METIHEELFSHDPDENMRIENNILKLKMTAEFGAVFPEETSNGLSPHIENQFLKNILAYEAAQLDVTYKKVYDLLERPQFRRVDELREEEVGDELLRLQQEMKKHGIALAVLAGYEDSTIYKFITEELFELETEVPVPGMVSQFTYEEFHPNHIFDIHSQAIAFLSGWFEQELNEHNWTFADNFILADGRIIARQDGLDKLGAVFEAYSQFEDCKYVIIDVNFHLNENGTGMGFAEGGVKYQAVLPSGEKSLVEGSFKLYMSLEYEWWEIFYFVFPGFEW